MYDPHMSYSISYFRSLSSEELFKLFEAAKRASSTAADSKLIRKILKDISNMRGLLKGHDSIHNGINV